MINIFTGMVIMYALAIPLIMWSVESADEEGDPNAAILFALMWPIAAIEIMYIMLRGGDNDGSK